MKNNINEAKGWAARYGILETVRQYGLSKLTEQSEAEEARRRQANFFVNLAERSDEGLRDTRQMESLATLDAEHDNLRAALRWSIENGNADLALRLVAAMVLVYARALGGGPALAE